MATENRERRLEEIYSSALQSDPGQRTELLRQACGEDDAMRSEIESLLRWEDKAGSFLEAPALEVLAGNIAGQPERLLIGATLGPYRVVSLLGVGGMGEVYAARDRRLGRLVALKILSPLLAADPRLKHRLLEEAKAASALNHPGIVTLYDVGRDGGIDYLVLEYVSGATLYKVSQSNPLNVQTSVRYAIEISDALAVAHAAGIVHRDLKPGNIMITDSGTVKVLDFGLARFEGMVKASGNGFVETESGVIAGTAAYMSPEQARGDTIDVRSDIFSFGVVVHEMLTGRHPFLREDRAGTLAAVINENPAGLRQSHPELTREIEAVVLRCLSKDPARRFQRMTDVKTALENVDRKDQSKPGLWIGIAVCICAALAGAVLYRKRVEPIAAESQWVRLTDFADSATQPAFSPDGKMLAFIRGADPFMSVGQIYVKSLPDGEPTPLTHDETLKMGPAFSPDGSRVAYSLAPSWDGWAVSLHGGDTKSFVSNAAGITWIDKNHLMFGEIRQGRQMAIVTAAQDGAGRRDVYIPPRANGMAHRSFLSPDRRWVLVVEMDNEGVWLPCRLVPFDGTSRGTVVGPDHGVCANGAWSPDGRWMYFSADGGDGFHIWRQRLGELRPEQITFGATEEEGIAVAPDGRSLVTSMGLPQSTVWLHDRGGDHQISSHGYALVPERDGGLANSVFSPDKKKLYYLVGKLETGEDAHGVLWVNTLDTGRNEPVLAKYQMMENYDISPDGKRVVFAMRDAERKLSIWLAPLDGQFPPRQVRLTSASDSRPFYGSHGELFFESEESGVSFMCRMREDGTDFHKLIPSPIVAFYSVSPDGRWAVAQAAAGEKGPRGVFAYSIRDGSRITICPGLCFPNWSPDGRTFSLGLYGVSGSAEKVATFAIPLPAHKVFPALPVDGIQTAEDVRALKGVRVGEGPVYFAADSSMYAYARSSVHRNIYQIPLRDF